MFGSGSLGQIGKSHSYAVCNSQSLAFTLSLLLRRDSNVRGGQAATPGNFTCLILEHYGKAPADCVLYIGFGLFTCIAL